MKPLKGLPADDEPVGESWEVSAVPQHTSEVKNGPLAGCTLDQLTLAYGSLLLGKAVAKKYGTQFPLLIKYIDAFRDLSIQVHPNDALAHLHHNTFGKTEMWFVMDAAPGACLYSGFNREVTPQQVREAIDKGTICNLLAKHEVKAGDVFYIPSGRIHAICGGILLAEIQQSSDVTYRIFDYNRPGLDGQLRPLHIDRAMEALDFHYYDSYRTPYQHCLNKPVSIIASPFFVTKLLEVDRAFHRKLYKYDSFIIYMCLHGNCTITLRSTKGFGWFSMPEKQCRTISLTEGNACLIPAAAADFHVQPDNQAGITTLLETYIDNKNF